MKLFDGQRVRIIALAAGCMALGAIVMPAGVAVAKQIQDVFVTNDAANPVPTRAIGTTLVSGSVDVAGSVNVGNTPDVTVAHDSSRVLGQGDGTLTPGDPDIQLPAGFVLTDMTFERQKISDSDNPCRVLLFRTESHNVSGGFEIETIELRSFSPSASQPVAEMHLETGIVGDGTLGFRLTNQCVVNVMWTGYTPA